MTPLATSATTLCQRLIADPALDPGRKSMAKHLLDLVDSVYADNGADPFYEDCIRYLTADIESYS